MPIIIIAFNLISSQRVYILMNAIRGWRSRQIDCLMRTDVYVWQVAGPAPLPIPSTMREH